MCRKVHVGIGLGGTSWHGFVVLEVSQQLTSSLSVGAKVQKKRRRSKAQSTKDVSRVGQEAVCAEDMLEVVEACFAAANTRLQAVDSFCNSEGVLRETRS